MFSLRIVTVDHYLAPPIAYLDPGFSKRDLWPVRQVPVIRIFGVTPAGQKACLHVHGALPYLCVPFDDDGGGDGPERALKFAEMLAVELDLLINTAAGRTTSTNRHVHHIDVFQGTSMYGFHNKQQTFLKIFFYNPYNVKKVADLLLSGMVLKRVMQPYEAHIPFTLQFLIDHSLHGMSFVTLDKFKFRRTSLDLDFPRTSDLRSTPGLWILRDLPTKMFLDATVRKQTTCELELDCCSDSILSYNSEKTSQKDGMNPGLSALWQDEWERRRRRGDDTSMMAPLSVDREGVMKTESELFYLRKLDRILRAASESSSQASSSRYSRKGALCKGNRSFTESMSQILDSQDLSLAEMLAKATSGEEWGNIEQVQDADSVLSVCPSQPSLELGQHSMRAAEEDEEDDQTTLEMSQVFRVDSDPPEESADRRMGISRARRKSSSSSPSYSDGDQPYSPSQVDGTDDREHTPSSTGKSHGCSSTAAKRLKSSHSTNPSSKTAACGTADGADNRLLPECTVRAPVPDTADRGTQTGMRPPVLVRQLLRRSQPRRLQCPLRRETKLSLRKTRRSVSAEETQPSKHPLPGVTSDFAESLSATVKQQTIDAPAGETERVLVVSGDARANEDCRVPGETLKNAAGSFAEKTASDPVEKGAFRTSNTNLMGQIQKETVAVPRTKEKSPSKVPLEHLKHECQDMSTTLVVAAVERESEPVKAGSRSVANDASDDPLAGSTMVVKAASKKVKRRNSPQGEEPKKTKKHLRVSISGLLKHKPSTSTQNIESTEIPKVATKMCSVVLKRLNDADIAEWTKSLSQDHWEPKTSSVHLLPSQKLAKGDREFLRSQHKHQKRSSTSERKRSKSNTEATVTATEHVEMLTRPDNCKGNLAGEKPGIRKEKLAVNVKRAGMSENHKEEQTRGIDKAGKREKLADTINKSGKLQKLTDNTDKKGKPEKLLDNLSKACCQENRKEKLAGDTCKDNKHHKQKWTGNTGKIGKPEDREDKSADGVNNTGKQENLMGDVSRTDNLEKAMGNISSVGKEKAVGVQGNRKRKHSPSFSSNSCRLSVETLYTTTDPRGKEATDAANTPLILVYEQQLTEDGTSTLILSPRPTNVAGEVDLAIQDVDIGNVADAGEKKKEKDLSAKKERSEEKKGGSEGSVKPSVSLLKGKQKGEESVKVAARCHEHQQSGAAKLASKAGGASETKSVVHKKNSLEGAHKTVTGKTTVKKEKTAPANGKGGGKLKKSNLKNSKPTTSTEGMVVSGSSSSKAKAVKLADGVPTPEAKDACLAPCLSEPKAAEPVAEGAVPSGSPTGDSSPTTKPPEKVPSEFSKGDCGSGVTVAAIGSSSLLRPSATQGGVKRDVKKVCSKENKGRGEVNEDTNKKNEKGKLQRDLTLTRGKSRRSSDSSTSGSNESRASASSAISKERILELQLSKEKACHKESAKQEVPHLTTERKETKHAEKVESHVKPSKTMQNHGTVKSSDIFDKQQGERASTSSLGTGSFDSTGFGVVETKADISESKKSTEKQVLKRKTAKQAKLKGHEAKDISLTERINVGNIVSSSGKVKETMAISSPEKGKNTKTVSPPEKCKESKAVSSPEEGHEGKTAPSLEIGHETNDVIPKKKQQVPKEQVPLSHEEKHTSKLGNKPNMEELALESKKTNQGSSEDGHLAEKNSINISATGGAEMDVPTKVPDSMITELTPLTATSKLATDLSATIDETNCCSGKVKPVVNVLPTAGKKQVPAKKSEHQMETATSSTKIKATRTVGSSPSFSLTSKSSLQEDDSCAVLSTYKSGTLKVQHPCPDEAMPKEAANLTKVSQDMLLVRDEHKEGAHLPSTSNASMPVTIMGRKKHGDEDEAISTVDDNNEPEEKCLKSSQPPVSRKWEEAEKMLEPPLLKGQPSPIVDVAVELCTVGVSSSGGEGNLCAREGTDLRGLVLGHEIGDIAKHSELSNEPPVLSAKPEALNKSSSPRDSSSDSEPPVLTRNCDFVSATSTSSALLEGTKEDAPSCGLPDVQLATTHVVKEISSSKPEEVNAEEDMAAKISEAEINDEEVLEGSEDDDSLFNSGDEGQWITLDETDEDPEPIPSPELFVSEEGDESSPSVPCSQVAGTWPTGTCGSENMTSSPRKDVPTIEEPELGIGESKTCSTKDDISEALVLNTLPKELSTLVEGTDVSDESDQVVQQEGDLMGDDAPVTCSDIIVEDVSIVNKSTNQCDGSMNVSVAEADLESLNDSLFKKNFICSLETKNDLENCNIGGTFVVAGDAAVVTNNSGSVSSLSKGDLSIPENVTTVDVGKYSEYCSPTSSNCVNSDQAKLDELDSLAELLELETDFDCKNSTNNLNEATSCPDAHDIGAMDVAEAADDSYLVSTLKSEDFKLDYSQNTVEALTEEVSKVQHSPTFASETSKLEASKSSLETLVEGVHQRRPYSRESDAESVPERDVASDSDSEYLPDAMECLLKDAVEVSLPELDVNSLSQSEQAWSPNTGQDPKSPLAETCEGTPRQTSKSQPTRKGHKEYDSLSLAVSPFDQSRDDSNSINSPTPCPSPRSTIARDGEEPSPGIHSFYLEDSITEAFSMTRTAKTMQCKQFSLTNEGLVALVPAVAPPFFRDVAATLDAQSASSLLEDRVKRPQHHQGLAHWQGLILKEFAANSSFEVDFEQNPELRIAFCRDRTTVLTPARFAPSYRAVSEWARAQCLSPPSSRRSEVESTKYTVPQLRLESCRSEGGPKDNLDADFVKHSTPLSQARKSWLVSEEFLGVSNAKRRGQLNFNNPPPCDRGTRLEHASQDRDSLSVSVSKPLSLIKDLPQTLTLSPVPRVPLAAPPLKSLDFNVKDRKQAARYLSPKKNSNNSQLDGPTLSGTFNFGYSGGDLRQAKGTCTSQMLTTLSVEVHVCTRNDLQPNPTHDPVQCIFYCLRNDPGDEENEDRLTPGSRPLELMGALSLRDVQQQLVPPPFDVCDMEDLASGVTTPPRGNPLLRSGVSNLKVDVVYKETELFEALANLVHRWDPDILVGYEIEKSSWGYLLDRASQLKVDLRSMISRVPGNEVLATSKEADDWTAVQDRDVTVTGRIVLNLWRIMRKELTLNMYSFENVYYHVAHRRVPLYSFKTLTEWFAHNTDLYRWRTVEHYAIRAKGNLELMDLLDIVGKTSEMARIFGIQFFEVLSRGSQFRVESMMLRSARRRGLVALSPSVQQRARMRAMEFIPLVMEPRSAFYTSPVVVLDFQSLYPSIMIAHNYCFSTCLGKLDHFGSMDPFVFGCSSLTVPPKLLAILRDYITVSPAGVAFVQGSVYKGVLPQMLEEILSTRLMVKQAMKECKGDKSLTKVLDARQLGLKLISNVTYGYTAASFSGRMPCVELADSIVSKGRETLERAIKTVETTPQWGGKVIYGDTDSIFVLLNGKTKEQAFLIGQEIADVVTAQNPKPIKLKFEKVYLPCLLQTKKRYVGFAYETPDQKEPIYDAKGIETVRRDFCPAVSKLLEKSLRLLFAAHELGPVREYLRLQFTKILSERVSLQDFIFAKEFRGMSGYKPGACVPALEIARRLTRRDPRAEPRVGERVPYVVVYGFPGMKLIQLVRTPSEVLSDPSLRLNAHYYLTRVIGPALNRALGLLDADVLQWYGELPRPKLQGGTLGGRGTIGHYLVTQACPACGNMSRDGGLCNGCSAVPASAALALADRVHRAEKTLDDIRKICRSCMGFRGSECVSIDCPVLYKLARATKESELVSVWRSAIPNLQCSGPSNR